MYGYIYRITDTLTGKLYIGQHKYDKPELDTTYHGSGHIIKQIYNKRPETLLEEIIFIASTEDELNYFENYFIEHLNTLFPNGYNLNTGGDKKAPSEETRKRISNKLKGRFTGEESPHFGKHHTEEAKRKMSEAKKGQKAWNKGIQCKEDIKKAISDTLKGRYRGEESPHFGKHHTEETRRKISEKNSIKIDKELLYNEFVINKHNIKECSIIFNTSEGTIRRRLFKFGIIKNI